MSDNHNELVNKTIDINTFLRSFPNRHDFRDTKLNYDQLINTHKPLQFIPSSVRDHVLLDPFGYAVVLYGAFADGQRGVVTITHIEPYFYALVPKGRDPRHCIAEINLAITDERQKPKHMEVIEGKRAFMGWQPDSQTFIKLSFNMLASRAKAIDRLNSLGWKTYHNEKNNYFRTVSRDLGLTISSWVTISNYEIEENNDLGRIFKITLDDYKPITDFKKNPVLARDKLITLAWDIEVASRSGDFPVPENKEDKLFMIAASIHWHSVKTPLIQVCFVDHPTKPSQLDEAKDDLRPNYVTVVCGSEKNVILAFAYLFNKIKPDFCVGFNVNDFDWRWLCVRAYQYDILSEICDLMDEYKDNFRAKNGTFHPLKSLQYETFVKNQLMKDKDADTSVNKYLSNILGCYQFEHLKIDAETYADGHQLQFAGCISCDVRTIFRQYAPQSEKSSLNFFLNASKLRSKKEMPISEMNRIYWKLTDLLATVTAAGGWTQEQITEYEELQNGMREIAEYCVIDSYRCQELMQKQGVVFDKRGIADLTFCSIADSFTRAGGMKVINIAAHYAERENYVMNHVMPQRNDEKKKDKFPGAYVLNPKPGLVTSKLTFEERMEANDDFNSNPRDEHDCSFRHLRFPKLNNVTHERLNTVIKIFKTTIQKSIENKDLRVAAATEEQVNKYIELAKNKYTINAAWPNYDMDHPNEPFEFTNGELGAFREFLTENTGRPIAGLDFNSLYPSIIITYNLCPTKTISKMSCDNSDTLMLEKFKRAKDMGLFCNQQKFPYEGTTVYGFFVWHENRKGVKQSQMTEQMKLTPDFHKTYGVIPQMLLDIMALRKKAKKPKEYYEKIVEYVDLMKDRNFKYHNAVNAGHWDYNNNVNGNENNQQILQTLKISEKDYKAIISKGPINIPEFLPVVDILNVIKKAIDFDKNTGKQVADNKLSDIAAVLEIEGDITQIAVDDLEYYFSYYNSKQNALKLIMNTTYGKMGDTSSPICDIALAGSVTSYGQACLRQVEKFLREVLDCGVWYGDTDSMYKSVPEHYFTDVDKRYYSGQMSKIEYWEECVRIEFREVDGIRDQVNKMIREFTRSDQLNMAYEEVLFPSAWLSKKKYYGLPHFSEPNFSKTKLFIRGLETKKRGVSDVLRILIEGLLAATMRPSNIKEISDLVYDAVDSFYSRSWKLDDFAKAIQYKPKTVAQREKGKGNKAVLAFADRMAKQGIEVKPFERIKIVKVKRYPYKYDERGRKKNRGQGDFMELLEVAKKEGFEINIDDYMKSGIAGQLARLIVYRDEFYVEAVDSSDKAIKDANNEMIKRAKIHVVNYASKHFTKYENVGPLLKKCYGNAQAHLVELLKSTGNYNIGMKVLMKDYDQLNNEERFFRSICDEIDEKTNKAAKAENFVVNKGNIAELEAVYSEEKVTQIKSTISTYINQIYTTMFHPVYEHLKTTIEQNTKYISSIRSKYMEKLDLSCNGEYKFNADEINERMIQLERLASGTIETGQTELAKANEIMAAHFNAIKDQLSQQYTFMNRVNTIVQKMKDFRIRGFHVTLAPAAAERRTLVEQLMSTHGKF